MTDTTSTSSPSHLETLKRVLFSQLQSIQGQTLSEDIVESLLMTCGDSMLLAALDLVDSADVSKIVTETGRCLYRCAGTSTTYNVTLEPIFCPCPAFAQQVLYLRAHVVCKHVLACLLAVRLDRFYKREGSLDLLAQISLHSLEAIQAPRP